jgi:hypothetical protein
MPVKHVVADLYPPLQNQQVRGWHFRVVGTGVVSVGTAKQGPYKRWTFSLNGYPDDHTDPAACVLTEIEDRRTPKRAAEIGQMTPRFGPHWQGKPLHPTSSPPARHQHVIGTPSAHCLHQHATSTPQARHQYAISTPPTRHQHATSTPHHHARHQHAISTPSARHQHATSTPPGCRRYRGR